MRNNGANGDVTVQVRTQGDSTVEGKVYAPIDTLVTLTSGQVETIIEVPIINDDEEFEANEQFTVTLTNPAEQFKAAVRVGDDEGSASAGEWIAHIISLPFKLIFALTPPAHLGGGWPCFFVALLFIARSKSPEKKKRPIGRARVHVDRVTATPRRPYRIPP